MERKWERETGHWVETKKTENSSHHTHTDDLTHLTAIFIGLKLPHRNKNQIETFWKRTQTCDLFTKKGPGRAKLGERISDLFGSNPN